MFNMKSSLDYYSSKNVCNEHKHQEMRVEINLWRMNFENQNFDPKTCQENIFKTLKSMETFSNCTHIQVFIFIFKISRKLLKKMKPNCSTSSN
jgi:hypothetical protein